jgi:glycine/D-amino acid oxidase-like deaminating enzyme
VPHRGFAAACELAPSLRAEGLRGGLFCADELLLDPRQAIRALPAYLHERYAVVFRFGLTARAVESGRVLAGGEWLTADRIYICSGADYGSSRNAIEPREPSYLASSTTRKRALPLNMRSYAVCACSSGKISFIECTPWR